MTNEKVNKEQLRSDPDNTKKVPSQPSIIIAQPTCFSCCILVPVIWPLNEGIAKADRLLALQIELCPVNGMRLPSL